MGRDGKEIFGDNWDDNNFFKTLMDLKTYLQNNDTQGIQATLGKLDSHLNTINAQVSDIGGKGVRLEVRSTIIEDLELSYTERKSEIEDADIAEAIIDLNSKELVYNAVLSSASKVMALNLVDFI